MNDDEQIDVVIVDGEEYVGPDLAELVAGQGDDD